MDKSDIDNSLRAGPSNGESRTSADATVEVCPSYYGVGTIRSADGRNARSVTDDLRWSTDNDLLNDIDFMTGNEGKGGTRAATPASTGRMDRFWAYGSGTEGESGSETTTSQGQKEGKDKDKGEKKERYKRKRHVSAAEDEESPDKDKVEVRKPTSKRGRGRPPTTGKYVGKTKTKTKLTEAEQEALKVQAEREAIELVGRIPQLRAHRLSESLNDSDSAMVEEQEVTAAALGARITSSLGVITHVAQKSKNLSGPFVGSLNKATSVIQDSCVALLNRTASAETRALEAANKRLSKEISDLREELADVKRELASARPRATPADSSLRLEEMLEKAVREAISVSSARLDARLECLENRLLPEPRIRPPLEADNRKNIGMTAITTAGPRTEKGNKNAEPEPMVSTLMPPTNPGPTHKKKKKVKKSAAAAEAAAARSDVVPVPATIPPRTEEWSQVVGKKSKAQNTEEEKKRAPKKLKKKSRKLRTPKSAAVIITLQPGAEERGVSYKNVLEKAKQRIDLVSLDIPPVKFKVAVTGARMLEVPGSANKEKADLLAEKLKEVMGEEDVRITRPQKCAELRVQGLDDSASMAEIAQAIATHGGCAVGDIKVGQIKKDHKGCGTAWIKCPVEAAWKVTAPNIKVYVGWMVVRVTLLSARPMRCYRCHQIGHTRATCPSETDRSELCGQPGHMATQCNSAPHCALCAADGKPADHSVGSKPCGKPALKKNREGLRQSKASPGPATTSKAAAGAGVEVMEAQ